MKLNKTWLFTTYLLLFIFLISGSVIFNGCNTKTSSSFTPTGDTIADGKALVQQYCTSCHQLVPADAITKNIWRYHTLPTMSHFLKVSTYSITNYYKSEKDTGGIALDNWQRIVAYYMKVAPDTLKATPPPAPLLNDW